MDRTAVTGISARVLGCFSSVVLAILLSSSSARSEPAKTAHQYAAEAEAEYNLGHFTESIPLFEKAYKLKPAPILLFNLGQCHRHLGNNERALFFYRRYLDAAPEAGDRQDVEKRVADLERAIAEQAALKNRPPPDVRHDAASTSATQQPPPPASDVAVVKESAAPSPPPIGIQAPATEGGDSRRTLRLLAWSSGIASAGALIFGGVEAALWSKRVRAFDDHVGPSPVDPTRTSTNCGADQPNRGGPGCASLYNDLSSAKTLTIVGLTVGGLLAAGSVTLFILSTPPDGSTPTAQARAVCSPDVLSPGLSCRFSF